MWIVKKVLDKKRLLHKKRICPWNIRRHKTKLLKEIIRKKQIFDIYYIFSPSVEIFCRSLAIILHKEKPEGEFLKLKEKA